MQGILARESSFKDVPNDVTLQSTHINEQQSLN